MGEVNQNLEPFANDVVALFALDACNQAHAARVVFIARMVEALRLRETVLLVRYLHGYLLMNKIGLLFQSGLPITMWHFCSSMRWLLLKKRAT
jgi:hypothetical protein